MMHGTWGWGYSIRIAYTVSYVCQVKSSGLHGFCPYLEAHSRGRGNGVTIMSPDRFIAKMGTTASIIQMYTNYVQGKPPLHDAGQNREFVYAYPENYGIIYIGWGSLIIRWVRYIWGLPGTLYGSMALTHDQCIIYYTHHSRDAATSFASITKRM